MKTLLLALLFSSVAHADQKACIAIFEPRPCRGIERFQPYSQGILIPAKFGNWDRVFDEYGHPLEFRWGLLRGTAKFFYYKTVRQVRFVQAERPDAVCLFARTK